MDKLYPGNVAFARANSKANKKGKQVYAFSILTEVIVGEAATALSLKESILIKGTIKRMALEDSIISMEIQRIKKVHTVGCKLFGIHGYV